MHTISSAIFKNVLELVVCLLFVAGCVVGNARPSWNCFYIASRRLRSAQLGPLLGVLFVVELFRVSVEAEFRCRLEVVLSPGQERAAKDKFSLIFQR